MLGGKVTFRSNNTKKSLGPSFFRLEKVLKISRLKLFFVPLKFKNIYFLTVGNYGSEWHTTEQQITSAYRAFSSEKIVADLGVHIGFGHVNVSLRCKF